MLTNKKYLGMSIIPFCLLLPLTSVAQSMVEAITKNTKPSVNAGADQTVYAGETVNLIGLVTDKEGDSLTYLWDHPGTMYAKVFINSASTLTANFTAPTTNQPIRLNILLTAQDAKGAKAKDNVFITIKPKPVIIEESLTKINDTGMTLCGDYARGLSGINNNDVICQLLTDAHNDPVPQPQDGSVGRDITSSQIQDGYSGFSFSKLNSLGQPVDAATSQWSCVKDNVTGLFWEVKTDDSGLHDKDDSYVWYESDSRLGNGGLPGYQRASEYDASKNDSTCFGYDASNSNTYCNTKAFVNRVNQQGFCGANNWRLPTREELHSLVSYDLNPRIDSNFFPNTQANYYWTSVPYAYLNKHVWAINFQAGGGSPWEKHYNYPVRLVHN